MSIYKRITMELDNYTNWMRLSVKGMDTKEDYDIIAQELLKVEGIKEIAPYTNKILKLRYISHTFKREKLLYTLRRLGYGLNHQENLHVIKSSNENKKGG
ncbi:hypothetical protein [Alkaliphilus serpentinus]|uniref:Uncharacterized protein n=1 Tax=Alkaliphilus serpentinus TaxID=1482731 RepID=A0A833M8Y4_9FIRM|nr:hypothetical protein [Alkaliphilus serpentinus]KAB3527641.1 hypothetical protein F8153_11705 [Alkaliphilus serpentinus]